MTTPAAVSQLTVSRGNRPITTTGRKEAQTPVTTAGQTRSTIARGHGIILRGIRIIATTTAAVRAHRILRREAPVQDLARVRVRVPLAAEEAGISR